MDVYADTESATGYGTLRKPMEAFFFGLVVHSGRLKDPFTLEIAMFTDTHFLILLMLL